MGKQQQSATIRLFGGLGYGLTMELEPLLTSTRWQILSLLAEKRFSPLEMSLRLKTSLANVSSQLRLLEFAGLVKTERISQREKGKPRVLYGIADDFGYLVLLSPGTAHKSLVSLSLTQKLTMQVWVNAPAELHAPLTAFFAKIEDKLGDIDAILLSHKHDQLTLVSTSKDLKRHEGASLAPKLGVTVVEPGHHKAKPDTFTILHRKSEAGA